MYFTELNAVMRTIDLTTFILAPIVVGQIITYVSKIGGAGFIAAWNIFSGVAELVLLTQLFEMVPELSKAKKEETCVPFVQITCSPESDENSTPNRPLPPKENANYLQTISPNPIMVLSPGGFEDISLVTPQSQKQLTFGEGDETGTSRLKDTPVDRTIAGADAKVSTSKFKQRLNEAYAGWREYFNHPVKLAGLALASLYMTVLGFDSITTGELVGQFNYFLCCL